MSALETFNNHYFSELYLVAFDRIMFPCQNEEEINQWKEKDFLVLQYLEEIGIDKNKCHKDQKAFIICCNLWMELLNITTLEKEAVGQAGGSTQVRVAYMARENPLVMDTSKHLAGEEPEPEPGLGLRLGAGGDDGCMNITDETVEYPGSIVLEWAQSLNNFFYSEDQCKSCGLAKVILMVGKGWMEIAKQSEFMQGSFRRHQWREALLIGLGRLKHNGTGTQKRIPWLWNVRHVHTWTPRIDVSSTRKYMRARVFLTLQKDMFQLASSTWNTFHSRRKYTNIVDSWLDNHLIDDHTQEEVASVMFNLLAEKEIERLVENQANIKNLSRKIKCRKAMSDWGHGDMHGIGSRQPARGQPGDDYAPYPESTVLSQENIHTLFAYASDIECMLAMIEPHAPSVVSKMKAIGMEACMLRSYGITGYHCWNYIAPQHLDKDGTWTISYQLFKKGCIPDEFNFCFSHFGKVLDMVENCVWWFKGDHMHGTVAPRASLPCLEDFGYGKEVFTSTVELEGSL
ncbi:hypothetical protein EV363DRAFT_1291758 [Boletus edulis]|nr:hypothetical protein EV363DRAFT_1291758 [Boletus edulis]